MGFGGLARRPGLALAVCAWVAFAARAVVAVNEATSFPTSFRQQIEYLSLSLGVVPAFCLVVAGLLALVERSGPRIDGLLVPIVAVTIVASAGAAIVVTVAGLVVLPIWSTPEPAWQVLDTLAFYLTTTALAALAAVLAFGALRAEPLREEIV